MTADPYRRLAPRYDRLIEPLDRGLRRVAMTLHPPEPGWRVLDVGCGTGTGLAHYVEAGCRTVGVDVSPAMLEQAVERLGDGADLRLVDGTKLPFEDGSFDLVMASMVLHEVPAGRRVDFLREMGRVAGRSGTVQITDFRFGSLRGWRGPFFKLLNLAIERFSGHYEGYRSFRAGGGVAPPAAAAGLRLDREKIVAGGNVAVYLMSVD